MTNLNYLAHLLQPKDWGLLFLKSTLPGSPKVLDREKLVWVPKQGGCLGWEASSGRIIPVTVVID